MKEPATPCGLPNALVVDGSTGGRETGRGATRSLPWDWSCLVTRVITLYLVAANRRRAPMLGLFYTLPALAPTADRAVSKVGVIVLGGLDLRCVLRNL